MCPTEGVCVRRPRGEADLLSVDAARDHRQLSGVRARAGGQDAGTGPRPHLHARQQVQEEHRENGRCMRSPHFIAGAISHADR